MRYALLFEQLLKLPSYNIILLIIKLAISPSPNKVTILQKDLEKMNCICYKLQCSKTSGGGGGGPRTPLKKIKIGVKHLGK
jgi:hypothetical protein